MRLQNVQCTRRRFTAGLFAGAFGAAAHLQGAQTEPPRVTNPRATDGDERMQPVWEELLTITVGSRAGEGDFSGGSERVLQAAVDSAARNGGGTVKLLAGTWTLRNSVFLPSGIRLIGSGDDTVLTRPASVATTLAADSDWYDQEITLASGSGFQVGDGVLLRAVNPHNGAATVIKRTLTARSGNRFRLNNGLRENLWLSGKPTCSTLYPLLTSEFTADVVIEDLVLDGNRGQTEHLDGNYGGCIFLQDCNRYVIRRVTARNNNGDGISFQICHDVTVEGCRSCDNADLGVHPGSGSQRPIIRNNQLCRNSQGLFWCWGVKYGLAEGNLMEDNRLYGVSIGHNDTDNLMRDNRITGSGQFGVLFRNEDRGLDFWPNRNVLENNVIENSGGDDGVAIEVTGKVRDLVFSGNTLRESRGPAQRTGIRIAAAAGSIRLESNSFSGLRTDVLDQRRG
ncbi:MAG: hypothetical protein RL215_1194 [Planctomycetota bacterium]